MADWALCSTEPGAAATPSELEGLGVEWLPATVPGTAAGALRDAGRWSIDDPLDFDARDWWWRARFGVPDGHEMSQQLRIGGLATIADVWCAGQHVLHSENMYRAHNIDLGVLPPGDHEVVIRCAALAPLLAEKRPRPRWKTRLVQQQALRWFRTTLLGRMPGWAPTGAPVGPWRGCELVPQQGVVSSTLRAACDGDDGVVDVRARLWTVPTDATIRVGDAVRAATIDRDGVHATVRVPGAQRWWPHTHGEPALYDVEVIIGQTVFPLGRVGFRTIDVDTQEGAFRLRVNGLAVFCRGAAWMPVDPVSFTSDYATLCPALEDVRRANMNMLRVSGTTVYETDEFLSLCDELGILVWHDLMFANMDPPDDAEFVSEVEAEVAEFIDRAASHAALAVICGGSEVEQQASMLGLPRQSWTMPLFDERIPALLERSAPGTAYVTSTPTGGPLPFHSDTRVAHYYGVGAYLRPITDARRANVRFASECLAFSNVPDESSLDQVLTREGVPRDNGSDWDFADVRDHYIRELYAVEPRELLQREPARYLDLARAGVGEVMAGTIAEWRRVGSTCAGALIWFLRDLRPGAGWGIVDATGRPKAPWWYVKRAMAPVALFALDEGLNGLDLHVVNDADSPVDGVVRVELYARGELLSEHAESTIEVGAHSARVLNADALFNGFRDLTWAYRFGPASYDVIASTLIGADGEAISRAFHLPLGLARDQEPDIGLRVTAERIDAERWALTIEAARFAQSVSVRVDGFDPDDNWFHVAPGRARSVVLRPTTDRQGAPAGEIRALNAVAGCSFDGASASPND